MELLYAVTYLVILYIGAVNSDILVFTEFSNQLIEEFRDLPAKFGRQLPANGFRVHAVTGVDNGCLSRDDCQPSNGCQPLRPPKIDDDTKDYKWAVLIARYNCTFEEKIRNAQLSGYDAAIVYNLDSNDLQEMSAQNDDGITIPSVFVGETTGKILMFNYQSQDGFVLVINDQLPFNINTHLILPFSIVVGLCFIIMIGFMIVKCVREQRRLRRHRLPSSLLKTIPTIKFNKNHPYETCVICLDEYVEGDKLRVLPCAHAYHCKCIDQWLTKNRRFCPICKRKVLPRRQPRQRRSSDSSSDSEDATDTTPLINPVEHGNSHGTFEHGNSHGTFDQTNNDEGTPPITNPNQRVNPFDRSPNLPPNISSQTENLTIWSRVRRIFRLPRATTQNGNEDIESPIDEVVPVDTVAVAAAPSNNILNSNSSGSFRDSDEEEQMMERNIYEPIPSTIESTQLPQSKPAATSTSTQARLGVAAIPNTQFCPTTPLSSDGNDDDFVV